MALMTVQPISLAGLAPTYGAVTASDTFPNDGKTYLHVKNGSGASINVTLDDVNTVSPPNATSFNPDVVVAVPAGGERIIGPVPPSRFNNATGLTTVTYSATTTVTAAAIQLPS